MARQTTSWDQWIVVNDGDPYDYTMGQEVVRRTPIPGEPHSFLSNLHVGLKAVRGDFLFFIEDDDWFDHRYLNILSRALDSSPLVGVFPSVYYNLRGKYWVDMGNLQGPCQTSLGMTAMHASLIPKVQEYIASGGLLVDSPLWRQNPVQLRVMNYNCPQKYLHVGFKGCPGTPGITMVHRSPDGGKLRGKVVQDPTFALLKMALRQDAEAYIQLYNTMCPPQS